MRGSVNKSAPETGTIWRVYQMAPNNFVYVPKPKRGMSFRCMSCVASRMDATEKVLQETFEEG